jgi:hypothetical protein
MNSIIIRYVLVRSQVIFYARKEGDVGEAGKSWKWCEKCRKRLTSSCQLSQTKEEANFQNLDGSTKRFWDLFNLLTIRKTQLSTEKKTSSGFEPKTFRFQAINWAIKIGRRGWSSDLVRSSVNHALPKFSIGT